jgi:hypothetical protein
VIQNIQCFLHVFVRKNSYFWKKIKPWEMKRLASVLVALLLSVGLWAQTIQDTTRQDTAAVQLQDTANLNTVSNQISIPSFSRYQPIVPIDVAGIYLANISRMLFWPQYQQHFVIGVTNEKVKYQLARFFEKRKIHGKPVDVVLVNQNNLPFVNLVYVTADHSDFITTLELTYQGKHVIIVSENPSDIALADIVLVSTYTEDGDQTYSYEYNTFSIKSKGVYIMPEMKAYSVTQ